MKKQKKARIIMTAAAVLTVVLAVMSIVMLRAVKGDDLFYMDSRKGYFYARAYRWVCLAAGLLILFWIVFIIRKRKEILAKLPKVELKRKENVTVNTEAVQSQPAAENEKIFCSGCGRQISASVRFCPFCGTEIKK